MKLRKLLAGITAAALAVSAMAFSSLTASAATLKLEETDYATSTANKDGSYSKGFAVTGLAATDSIKVVVEPDEGVNAEGWMIAVTGTDTGENKGWQLINGDSGKLEYTAKVADLLAANTQEKLTAAKSEKTPLTSAGDIEKIYFQIWNMEKNKDATFRYWIGAGAESDLVVKMVEKKDPADDKLTYPVELWKDELTFPKGWTTTLKSTDKGFDGDSLKKVKEGDKIVIAFELTGEAEYPAIGLRDGASKPLPSYAADKNYDNLETSPFTYVVKKEDLDVLTKDILIIGGEGFKLTSVTLEDGTASTTKPEETKPTEIKANAVIYAMSKDYKTWTQTKGTEVTITKDGATVDLEWDAIGVQGESVLKDLSQAGVQIVANKDINADFVKYDGQYVSAEITNIEVTGKAAAEDDTSKEEDKSEEKKEESEESSTGTEAKTKSGEDNGTTEESETKDEEKDGGSKTEAPKPTKKDNVTGKDQLKLSDKKDSITVTFPIASITEADLGSGIKLTLKVSLAEAPAAAPTNPDSGSTTPSAPTVSGNKHQGIGMPPVVINQKSAPAASTGAAAASGSTSVTLSDSTVVSKDVIDSVSGKDAEFKLANGASWEIAAADVAKAEGMDLGITLNTTAATADQLKEVAQDNDTFQFSLAYSGDFGFSAVINIPVDAKNNGKYANLYWFNNGKFEFIGSSKVEGGIADFTMKHASDYVIVFDDEAYGEDVSSGAGVYEEESETSAPAAVVVTFAALAVSAVILKKRVF